MKQKKLYLSRRFRMYKVHVLEVGYSIEDQGSRTMKANCTCSLITNGSKNIVVDTMTPWDGQKLLKKLKESNILRCFSVFFIIQSR